MRRRLIGWACVAVVVAASATSAAPVRVRYPEGPAHGFVALSDLDGKALAHGELIQWLEGAIVASRLVIRFEDGSLYDETVRFSQRGVFRLESYRLRQNGRSFTETTDVVFARGGRYRVRRRAAPDADEEQAAGVVEVPEDASNGMASIALKNLMPNGSATVHVVAFLPKPRVLELHLTPEGADPFLVGVAKSTATRFLLQPEVGGVTGVFATLAGKQPPPVRMWIARGRAPVLVKVEGPLYSDGPPWRVELSAPTWR